MADEELSQAKINYRCAIQVLKPNDEIASLRKQLSESEAEIAEYKSESWCFNELHATLTAEVAALKQALEESEEGRKRHEAAVGRFLSDMYCALIDPLADGQMKVAEMCKVLLEEAVKQRQRESDLINEVSQWESRFRIAVEQMQSARNGKWSADQRVQSLTAELEKSVERYGESYVIRDQLRQALEAAKGALRSADEVFDSTWAANWDKHYGKGLSVEYAQAISIQLTNLRQRFKVALAQIESLTGHDPERKA